MQLLAIATFLIAMGFYINRSVWTTKLIEEVVSDEGRHTLIYRIKVLMLIFEIRRTCILFRLHVHVYTFRQNS